LLPFLVKEVSAAGGRAGRIVFRMPIENRPQTASCRVTEKYCRSSRSKNEVQETGLLVRVWGGEPQDSAGGRAGRIVYACRLRTDRRQLPVG